MNILFITPFIPHENAKLAGVNCTYNLIKLIRENFNSSIDIIGTINKEDSNNGKECSFIEKRYFYEITKVKKIINICRNIHMPALISVRYDGRVKKKLKELAIEKKYDYIFCDYTQSCKYVDDIKEYFPKSKTILIEQDVSFLAYERKYLKSKNWIYRELYYLEYKRIRKFECYLAKKFDWVCTLNDKDAKLLNMIKQVIQLKPFIKDWNIQKVKHDTFNIMFWGAMNRKENEDAVLNFIQNIWINIDKNNCKFYIIGANPSEKIKILSSENIIVTGFVKNPKEYFDIMDISVVPLRLGAGIKIKVLESMINGIPVVTSSIGAEGINILNEVNGFVTDEDIEFASIINTLKNNKNILANISKNGRETAINKYSFSSNKDILKKIFYES